LVLIYLLNEKSLSGQYGLVGLEKLDKKCFPMLCSLLLIIMAFKFKYMLS